MLIDDLPWALGDTDRCAAKVLQLDDRWGGIWNRCQLVTGHPAAHAVAMTACEPVAVLAWDDHDGQAAEAMAAVAGAEVTG